MAQQLHADSLHMEPMVRTNIHLNFELDDVQSNISELNHYDMSAKNYTKIPRVPTLKKNGTQPSDSSPDTQMNMSPYYNQFMKSFKKNGN